MLGARRQYFEIPGFVAPTNAFYRMLLIYQFLPESSGKWRLLPQYMSYERELVQYLVVWLSMQCLQYDELRYDTTNHPDSRGVLPVKRVFTGCTVKTGFYRETYGFTCFYRTSDFMTGFTGSRQLCNGNGILDSSFLDRQSLFFGAPVKTGFYRNSQRRQLTWSWL